LLAGRAGQTVGPPATGRPPTRTGSTAIGATISPRSDEHVLVTRLDSDGDVLLQGPAIRAIAARAGRVTLLAGPRGVQAARLLPGADDVEVFHAPWIDAEPRPVDPVATAGLVRRLTALRVDRALVLGSFHQSPLPTALLLRLAGVPWIGAVCEDYPGSLLDLRHRVPGGLHEAERGMCLAAAAGYPLPEGDDGALRVRRDPASAPGGLPGRYVVVHPGASVPARAWPATHHARLARALTRAGRRVVVTGGPAERDLTAAVAAAAGAGAVDLGGRTTLAGLAEVLAGADAAVVANTGPAHLAAAVGTPVAWLHAPTVPARRWHPWRVPFVRLAAEVPCAGCRARTCPVPGHPCMSAVTPGKVADAVDLLTTPAREVAACAS
jgi:ADP-heptose:LPS heptosyltransferase